MDNLNSWARLIEVIEPHYPKAGNGRRPYPLETMLRIHFMQHWYSMSDPAMGDALTDIAPIRMFAGLSPMGSVPDHTTIMRFSHLLELHGLARQIFEEVSTWLSDASVLIKEGTLMGGTIIEAPSSTDNKAGECDLEMYQTKMGNQWPFGMKAHIGVEAKSGLTHSFTTTAALIRLRIYYTARKIRLC